MTPENELSVAVDGHVGVVMFNRPRARNAITVAMQEQLPLVLDQLRDDARIRVVVVAGAGGAFCSGADIGEMQADAAPRRPDDELRDLAERQRAAIRTIWEYPKPTLASIDGPAVGAGLGIALACDLRYMAADAFLMTGFVKIGLPGDFGVNWLLTRLAGPSKARELMLFSERVTAIQAVAWCLAAEVVSAPSAYERVMDRARALAEASPTAIRFAKENITFATSSTLWDSMDHEAALSITATAGEHHRQAVSHFVGRRSPDDATSNVALTSTFREG